MEIHFSGKCDVMRAEFTTCVPFDPASAPKAVLSRSRARGELGANLSRKGESSARGARDKEGKAYAMKAVNAMLLNEFLKEHRKNEEQEATIARQQKQIDALAAGLQEVSAQLELVKPHRKRC
jgi:hypothetical protein